MEYFEVNIAIKKHTDENILWYWEKASDVKWYERY